MHARLAPIRAVSHVTLRELFAAKRRSEPHTLLSLDLGLSTTQVALEAEGIVLGDGQRLAWSSLQDVLDRENVCFRIEGDALVPTSGYSEATKRSYQL